MEPSGVSNFGHRRSPSSDRFLDVFSQTTKPNAGGNSVLGDELNEDDVFWTGDFAEPNRKSNSPSADANKNNHRFGFGKTENFGILAALPDESLRNRSVLYRKPSISSSPSSSSKMIPAIPKPLHEKEFTQSMPARKFHQSAPMNVPVLSKAMSKTNEKNRVLSDLEDDEEDEMLPPHEIVARGSGLEPKTTFSVLEGVGRTLKGRDLRQVRNAVFRRTGFLD